jgi:hypothetical protein
MVTRRCSMKFSIGRVASAAIIVGVLGIGGAGYAYAQTSSTSPSTTAPGAGHGGANCPNMGSDTGGTSPSQM